MTRYRLSDGAHLTDFKNGSIADPATGASVPATEAVRAVAAHFAQAADWSAFPRRDDPACAEAFETLRAAGLLLDHDGAADPAPDPAPQTMFDLPHRRLDDIEPGEIVFLGAPIDIGTTGLPGARLGPAALRTASVERYSADYDVATGRMRAWNLPSLGGGVLGGARMSDLGDLAHVPGEPAPDYYARLRHVVDRIYAQGGFPVVLGGDHSITYATVPLGIQALVHLDAHCDLAERVPGHCHHHGNVIRRLVEEKAVGEVHHLGLRDTSGWDTLEAGTFARSVHDLALDDWSDRLAGRTVFLSLDVDVLDPSVLPGTGTPVPGGVSLERLCTVLARIVALTRPVGLDIVELSPILDSSRNSERTAIEVLLCFLAIYHRFHVERDATQ